MTEFARPASHRPPRRGLMFVLSSPSGAGKTTLSRRLLEGDGDITLSVSATTRPPRPGEVDGKDYWFVSPDRFADMVRDDQLLEWATVFGHRYGTPRGPVEAALHEGHDVLFDIDWQGTQQLQQTDAASDLVRVFILPPDLAELERRLMGRATDPIDVITGRMARARDEISHWGEYDYILVNDNADLCLAELRAILKAERLRRKRQLGLADFVRGMLGQ
ncbi:guanylate kinase [Polymorphobacter fuscus]|uniref:Guanylate kinase n=1 Tax=Sandarakinorhabdus fusca TaxID=1439888 RepID=A0A7C9GQK5_9SPHN|nr:guanylate kinase [Polymorphobacter fuscus]KAB7646512.1 guanylate kinase [Polymorphobacter fuscus]MQT17756.1 guanylate kinase [Polymorphobacter fuscus]NJC09696.1 guanylate kinase [Polymorphobacter fuscus]